MINIIILWLVIAGIIVAGTLRFIAIRDPHERNELGFPRTRRLYRKSKEKAGSD